MTSRGATRCRQPGQQHRGATSATGCLPASACWRRSLALVALGALLYDVIHDGVGRLSWQFLTSYPVAARRRSRDLSRRSSAACTSSR